MAGDQLFVPVLFSFVMFATAVFVALVRVPVSSGSELLSLAPAHLRVLGLGLSVIWVPQLIKYVYGGKFSFGSAGFFVLRFVAAFGLLFLPVIAFTALPQGAAVWVADVLIFGCLLASIYAALKSEDRVQNPLATFFLGAIVALAIALSVLAKGYVSPLAHEITLIGQQNRDPLFQAAISNMLASHGTASVGMDGLVPISYHVLSHRLLGAISQWTCTGALSSTYLLVYVVTLPLLFTFLLEAVFAFRPRAWAPVGMLTGSVLFLCWPFALSMFQTSAYFSSESYILSLVLMLAALPLLAGWVQENTGTLAKCLCGVLIFVGIFLTGQAKISTGAVLFTGVAFLICANARFSIVSFVVASLVALLPFAMAFFSVAIEAKSEESIISPLHFLFEWRKEAIFHIILTVVTMFILFKNLPSKSSERNIAFALAIMAVAALVSSLLLKLPAGAAIYFANPGMWICILIIGLTAPMPERITHLPATRQAMLSLILLSAIVLIENDRWKAIDKYQNNIAALEGAAPTVASDGSIATHLANNTMLGKMTAHVDGFAQEGRNPLIYVTPDFEEFWSQNKYCWAQAMTMPALAARPMLIGLPPQASGCEVTPYYGFASYDAVSSGSKMLEDSKICELATSRGFGSVVKFASETGRLINCN